MKLPAIPQATLAKWVGVLLLFGVVHLWGYHRGYESQSKAHAKALEKALKEERATHKQALERAQEDARRLSQEDSRGSNKREEYKRVEPSEVDSVNCVSGDQRMFIRGLVEPQG
jgi:hypothetical protein